MTAILPRSNGIGTLAEMSLHAELKRRYAAPGDLIETIVDGFVIDVIHGDELIEVQTGDFGKMKRKLGRLLENHLVRVVYPIPLEKWILKEGKARRKSPRRGRIEHVFLELVRFPRLVAHPNFSLEVLLTREEELQVEDGRGSWRRKGWSIADRRLVEVVQAYTFTNPADFRRLLPAALPRPFTTRQLADALGQPRYIAQKMAYCLREMDILATAGKRGHSYLYIEV